VVESKNKPPVTALREIAAGKVRYDRDPEEIYLIEGNPR